MHPAIELILARMESNPEEFKDSVRSRWNSIIIDLHDSCSEEEWNIVDTKIKAVRLDAVHQAIMQELCAPEQGELDFDPRLSSIITSKKMLNDAKDLFEAQMKREL